MIEQLKTERLKAMKAKDQTRLVTIRMILSTFETERGKVGRDLTKDEELSFVNRNRNNLLEEIASLESAGRDAAKQKEQLAIVLEFLPKQLTEDEVDTFVDGVIEAVKADGGHMGDAMKIITPELKGKADMKKVSGKVKEAFK